MAITYTIDHERKLIREVWTGEIDAAELGAYWERYLSDPEVMEIRRTLVDLRQAKILFTGAEMDDLIRFVVRPLLGDRDWKTAIVVESAMQFGVSRQYQAFAERYSKDAIFYSPEEAQKWLVGA
jgi:hypothetical protein